MSYSFLRRRASSMTNHKSAIKVTEANIIIQLYLLEKILLAIECEQFAAMPPYTLDP